MSPLIHNLFAVVIRLGPFGLLLMGILDSSFLFMPLGNDLLITALTIRNHALLPLYAALAALGSVLGCLLVDIVSRKGGEEGLRKIVSRRRFGYVKRKVCENAPWTLVVASLMPPPFPFTPFVAGAAALQYPRKRLLSVIAVARFIRFSLVGWLAIMFGDSLVQLAKSPVVQSAILALMVMFVIGSVYSIYTWIKRSRN